MPTYRIPPLPIASVLTLAVALGISSNLAASDNSAPSPIFPKALAPGDTIAFIAPAKYLNKKRIALASRRLEEMGFQVRMPDTLFRKKGYLAGTDEERAAELMAAFVDSEVDAVFPGTGGYGTTRIVDRLDYEAIRRNPKILIGFSDITALHIAINQRTGLVTFHSPVPEWGLGTDTNLSPFAAQWFWRAITLPSANGSEREWANGAHNALAIGYTIHTKHTNSDQSDERSIFDDVPPPVTLQDGTARGRLIGGNLSVLHALMGTPYEIKTEGRILFLEDVGEAPYRVDRMLCTLRLAGKFDRVAGVILGAFTARKDEDPWDEDATMDDVLRDYFADLGVPVVARFPVGHVRYNATLPIGALAELDAKNQTLRLLENPVAP